MQQCVCNFSVSALGAPKLPDMSETVYYIQTTDCIPGSAVYKFESVLTGSVTAASSALKVNKSGRRRDHKLTIKKKCLLSSSAVK